MERDGNRIMESTAAARAAATGQNVRTVLFLAVYLYDFA